MKHLLRQTIRGMTSLPHVGSHPGLPMFALMVLMGLVAGLQGGSLARGLVGVALMVIVFGSMLANGAYVRAQLSDGIEMRKS